MTAKMHDGEAKFESQKQRGNDKASLEEKDITEDGSTVAFPLIHGQFIYRDTRYPAFVVKDKLQTPVELPENSWVVVGYPKSGTNWLHEILYLIERDGEVESTFQTDMLVRLFLMEADLQSKNTTNQRLYKSHLSAEFWPTNAKAKGVKIVYILRDPRDAAVSYYNFYKAEFHLGNYTGSWDDFYKMFCAGQVVYGSWFDHVRKWWKCREKFDVLLITYEEMIRNLPGCIVKIATFLGKQLDQSTIETIAKHVSFEHMKSNPLTNLSSYTALNQKISPFHRKGVVGDWKNYFTVAQHEEFVDIYRKEMADIELENENTYI